MRKGPSIGDIPTIWKKNIYKPNFIEYLFIIMFCSLWVSSEIDLEFFLNLRNEYCHQDCHGIIIKNINHKESLNVRIKKYLKFCF